MCYKVKEFRDHMIDYGTLTGLLKANIVILGQIWHRYVHMAVKMEMMTCVMHISLLTHTTI